MRFTILRRFSHLIHRRTRSEPLAAPSNIDHSSPLDTFTRPRSLTHIDDLAANPRVSTMDTVIPSSEDSKLAIANRRIFQLEMKVAEQQATIDTLRFEAELRDEELKVFKSDFYTERSVAVNVTRKQKQYEEQATLREKRLAQYERYFELMRDVGLDKPLVSGPHEAMVAGDDFVEALIKSIQVAATQPQSLWSKIIPAVTGPRTQGEYVSAINATIKARRETRHQANRAKFWKRIARGNTNMDIVTPSPSNISEVSQKSLSSERQKAVDELLAKLRGGQVHLKGHLVQQAGASLSQPDESSILPYLHSESSQMSVLSGRSIVTSRSRDLAPLASQTFKEELIASHSSERFSLGKHVFGNGEVVKRVSGSLHSVSSYPSSGSDISSTLRAAAAAPSEPSFLAKLIAGDVFGSAEIADEKNSPATHLGTIVEEFEADTTLNYPPVEDADRTLVEDKQVSRKKSLLSRIPRRLTLSLLPSKGVTPPRNTNKSSQSLLKPTISSSLKQASSPPKGIPILKPVLPLRIVKKGGKRAAEAKTRLL